jgi:hypothetical protein
MSRVPPPTHARIDSKRREDGEAEGVAFVQRAFSHL